MKQNNQRILNKSVSVDCVIFGFDFENLKVLLIQREQLLQDTETRYSLPGDLIFDDEILDDAAIRVLKELTGLENIYLEQFGAFSDLDRLSKPEDKAWLKSVRDQPESRVVTVAYYALVNLNSFHPAPSNFATSATWQPISDINSLAFDHFKILTSARKALQSKLQTHPIGFNLLPEKFTLSQLHRLYEAIVGRALDKRNFRRKMIKLQIVKKLNEKQQGVPHKPSSFYEFNLENYEKLMQEGFENFGF